MSPHRCHRSMCEDNFANQKWSQQDSKFAAALKFNFGSATTTARVRGAGGRAGQGAAVWRLWLNYGKMWRGGHHGSTVAAPWQHHGVTVGVTAVHGEAMMSMPGNTQQNIQNLISTDSKSRYLISIY